MRKIFINMLLSLAWLASGMAVCQTPASDSSRLFLVLSGGGGYGLYRDLGNSARQYVGLELAPGMAVDIRSRQWRMDISLQVDAGAYGLTLSPRSFRCFGGQPRLDVLMLWKCLDKSGWRLWLGGSLGDWGDIRYNSLLGNSCVGVSNCIYAAIAGRADYSLRRWNFYAQLAFQPIGLLLRPGYAFTANYDRDIANPVANTFNQYHWYVAEACGVTTLVGAELTLRSGNRIGLAYHWHHLTSRTTLHSSNAPWRFDQSSHQLLLSLAMAL